MLSVGVGGGNDEIIAEGIMILCKHFECIEGGFNREPASTMHHLLDRFIAMLFCFSSKNLYGRTLIYSNGFLLD